MEPVVSHRSRSFARSAPAALDRPSSAALMPPALVPASTSTVTVRSRQRSRFRYRSRDRLSQSAAPVPSGPAPEATSPPEVPPGPALGSPPGFPPGPALGFRPDPPGAGARVPVRTRARIPARPGVGSPGLARPPGRSRAVPVAQAGGGGDRDGGSFVLANVAGLLEQVHLAGHPAHPHRQAHATGHGHRDAHFLRGVTDPDDPGVRGLIL